MSGPVNVVTGLLAEHAAAVLREALSNVVHHAHARTVVITVSVDDALTLDVTDDGVGLPDTLARSGCTTSPHGPSRPAVPARSGPPTPAAPA